MKPFRLSDRLLQQHEAAVCCPITSSEAGCRSRALLRKLAAKIRARETPDAGLFLKYGQAELLQHRAFAAMLQIQYPLPSREFSGSAG